MLRLLATALVCISLTPINAFAHDFWVNATGPDKGIVKVDIGYGHGFPAPETIPEKRTKLFEVPYLLTPEGKVALESGKKNYAYQVKKDLAKGSYLAIGIYKPTFWCKNADGWAMKDRTQMPDATYCEDARMFAKAVLNVDGSQDEAFVTKPAGLELEIVPLINPAKVKPGDKLPVQVLYQGKPVKTEVLSAVFGGFSKNEAKAFYGRTDLRGKIDIIPLKAGYWYAKVQHNVEAKDKTKCDEIVLVTTLAFHISE
jgi:uncharacterized GH25 family protein